MVSVSEYVLVFFLPATVWSVMMPGKALFALLAV